jgi:putative transport protein
MKYKKNDNTFGGIEKEIKVDIKQPNLMLSIQTKTEEKEKDKMQLNQNEIKKSTKYENETYELSSKRKLKITETEKVKENIEEDKEKGNDDNVNEEKEEEEENIDNEEKENNDEKLFTLDKYGFCVFAFGALVGIFIGAIRIPLSKEGFDGSAFSLTTTGGVLLTNLILGHIGKIKKLSLKVDKKVLENLRELGLILFLLGSGIAGGTKFIEYFKAIYFLYGILITLIPLIVGFFFNKYILKLYLLNNLGSLTGAMTSTPALGTLISVAKTDQIGNSYAATYPISLISVVLSAQFMVLLMK